MGPNRLRIFISSPGDVVEERVLANNLVRRLSDEYADRLWIEPVFWEHEPLVATATFQTQIPPPRDCEVAICILWSRLGTRLPGNITRPDGSRYASGTEFEFEDAFEGRKKNGYPDLLVYRKNADPKVSLRDKETLLARLAQKEALDGFFQKWFIDDKEKDGIKAHFGFTTSAEFEQLLEEHLRKLIARRLPPGTLATSPGKTSWTAGSPFRGLDVFDFQHAPVFFGRTRAIGDSLNALRANAALGRAFLLVVGVSGGGKSSLVRAGVLPLLTQPGVIEGVGLWRKAIFKPSDSRENPLRALASALLSPEAIPELSSDGTTADQLAELLRQTPASAFPLIKGGLSQAAALIAKEQNLTKQPETRLVVVADQLEELFTLPNLTLADRQNFVAALSALARSGKVWVIATMRGDFYHRCFELPELVALQEGSSQYALPLPTSAEMAQMIRQPARAAGLGFEEDPQTKISLDEALREAASASPESLPLLEFTLEELYQRKSAEGLLTYAAYRQLGGVEGALAQRAEAIFASLPTDVQETLPPVMRGLVSVGDGEAVARQQATLEAIAPTPQGKAFVEAFVQARLFSADRTDEDQAVVRVTHEALLRNWPRLTAWLEKDRELLRVRGRVSAAAGRWEREKRRSDLLLPEGKPLEEGQWLRTMIGRDLSAGEREFIRASERRVAARRRAKRSAIAALAALTVLGFMLAVSAIKNSKKANANALTAAENAKEAKANADKAAENENAANKNATKAEIDLAEGMVAKADALALVGRVREANDRMNAAYDQFVKAHSSPFLAEVGLWGLNRIAPPSLMTFSTPGSIMGSVAFSPDGRTALSYSDDHTLKLWDVATGRELRTFPENTSRVLSVAFSPDGLTAISGNISHSLDLWDVTTGRELRRFSGHTNEVDSVAFSPDGRTALSGSGDNLLTLWDVATGRELRIFAGHAQAVNTVAFSPDGRTALSGSADYSLMLWDVATGRKLRTFAGHTKAVNSVAFSPDGRTALSGSDDNTLKLWDVATGRELRTFTGHTDKVTNVAFSPDGRTALSGSWDKILKRWDVTTGQELRTFTVLTNLGVHDVAFSPDGSTALTSMKLWDVSSGRELRTFSGHTDLVTGVAFSPDGRTALSCSFDGALKLWDVATGRELRTFYGYTGQLLGVAFSLDGNTALSGNIEGTPTLWDMATGRVLRSFTGHTDVVSSVAFSPDGRTAVSGSADKTLKLWDVATGQELRTFVGHTDAVCSVAFSPDGHTVLSGSGDNTLKIWDVDTGRELQTFRGHFFLVRSVAFSRPDGRTVLSGSGDGTLKLWDVATGREMLTFSGHTAQVNSVAFSPDGRTALSGSEDKTLKLWDVATGRELETFSGHTNGVWSVAFSPDGGTALSGSADKTLKLWDFSRALRYREFDKTVPAAQKALAANPSDGAALAVLGEWWAFRGRDDWAIECLEKARAAGADVSPLTLARCYWQMDRLDEARREFHAALEKKEAPDLYLNQCLYALDHLAATPAMQPAQ